MKPRPRRFRPYTEEEVRIRAACLRIMRQAQDHRTMIGVAVDAGAVRARLERRNGVKPAKCYTYRTDPDTGCPIMVEDGPGGLETRRRLKKARKKGRKARRKR